jgi:VIT1/CCC1 family predicted Fe2+/Mn2+ transporter
LLSLLLWLIFSLFSEATLLQSRDDRVDPRHSLAAEHSSASIRSRLGRGPRYSYLRDFIYGAIDGVVTTFAIVSGVAGAGLPTGVVIVLGLANLIADGFSMAASNYLGARSERQQRERLRRMEEAHIDAYPEGEREEIRQIFEAKGFEGVGLDQAVEIITAERRRWVDTMLQEEHGLTLGGPQPWRAAAATFCAFLVTGFVPLSPFVWNYLTGAGASSFVWSAGATAAAFLAIGAVKGQLVGQRWYAAGCETLALGGAAAAVAYAIGRALHHMA